MFLRLPGTSELTDYGHMKIKNVARLKERHGNVSLSSLSTFDAVQAVVLLLSTTGMFGRVRPPATPPTAVKLPS